MQRNYIFAMLCALVFTHTVWAQAAQPCVAESATAATAKAAVSTCAQAHPDVGDQILACKGLVDQSNAASTLLATCKNAAPATQGTVDSMSSKVDQLQQQLDGQKDSDFELELGIGSLLRNDSTTDYSNNSNTLAAATLGKATPQYLVGVAMRSGIPNFPFRDREPCKAVHRVERGESPDINNNKALAALCPGWREHPFAGFLSLKFSPDSTQTINGYVLGGSYRAMHYMNILVGFALTPVNEPSYGLRITASQYVANQQKVGSLLNFNATAMLNNDRNAFDGFSLADTSGKLIYLGTALETHYRGGVVIGVSVPISFSDFFKSK